MPIGEFVELSVYNPVSQTLCASIGLQVILENDQNQSRSSISDRAGDRWDD